MLELDPFQDLICAMAGGPTRQPSPHGRRLQILDDVKIAEQPPEIADDRLARLQADDGPGRMAGARRRADARRRRR